MGLVDCGRGGGFCRRCGAHSAFAALSPFTAGFARALAAGFALTASGAVAALPVADLQRRSGMSALIWSPRSAARTPIE